MSKQTSSILDSLVGAARLRIFVWASLVSQILIVVTGAAVRLTGSGLGCPTWPKCTNDSLVNVPEMGIHGVIEFTNRTLTFVLTLIALLTFVAVLRLPKAQRAGLVWTSLSLGLGIVAQAVIGGISVLTKLTWWVVGLHFVVSAILIAIATILVRNFYRAAAPELNKITRGITWPMYLIGLIAVLLGVVVTGAGPHAGDFNTPRSGFDLETVMHYHSYPAYALFVLALIGLVAQWRAKGLAFKVYFALVLTLVYQLVVGLAQARLGVPPLLVALHMLGAAVLVSLLTAAVLLTRPLRRID